MVTTSPPLCHFTVAKLLLAILMLGCVVYVGFVFYMLYREPTPFDRYQLVYIFLLSWGCILLVVLLFGFLWAEYKRVSEAEQKSKTINPT